MTPLWKVAVPLALASLAPVAMAFGADDVFPAPYDSEKANARPLPADEAARGFRLPEGFSSRVFAAEPDVRNPIAMAWDGRGRLWVAENYTYSERELKFDLALRDRVLIFSDADGDGRPEGRKVFLDSARRLTSVEVGHGGAWLMCPPQLLFVPDADGDDVPDGPARVVLDGFDVPAENYHNFANGLRWGPDGWLYGRCGASSPGKVRRPDESPESAIPLAGGVWRYHPRTRVFEPLSHGTTNPWGLDWDEHGEGFFVNSVNGHLWHLIPGAHYRRPHTIDPSPLAYEPMEMHADHWHWDTGKDWVDSRKPTAEHDRAGGGHAHAGAMIYLGGQWPDAYRNRLVTLNLHGRRANVERLEREGSGYRGRRDPDFLFSADPFFRGIDLSYGPDGSVFVLDWSDTGECHENSGVHRNSGRIFQVRHGSPPAARSPDLTAMSDRQLIDLHSHPNEWYARQARRELANRSPKDPGPLLERLDRDRPTIHRLRALWTLHTIGRTDDALLTPMLADPDEHIRSWAIRLLTDAWPLDTVIGTPRAEGVIPPSGLVERFARMAREDDSGLVRLVLASTLQRLPIAHRPALAAALLARSEDADDPNLSHLVWYGLIPLAQGNPEPLARLATEARLPRVRRWIARRFAEVLADRPALLDGLLAMARDADEGVRRDMVAGMADGLAGVRKAAGPPNWASFPRDFPESDPLHSAARGLDVVFGDGRALEEVRRVVLDPKAALNQRKAALSSLIDAGPSDLRPLCEALLKERFLNTVALQGLIRFDDPAVGRLIARSYPAFHPSERPAVVEALASRPAFAGELLERIESGAIPRAEMTAFQARRVLGFGKPDLASALARVWGELRDSPKEKADLIARFKAELTPAALGQADRSRGRSIFDKTCSSCHRLFGAGGEVGPDLTGAGRKDLDYLLMNVVDPSAVVNKDFQMTVFALKDGRTINGAVVRETDRAVTVQTERSRETIARDDLEERKLSSRSLMPDGLLEQLALDQVRDLIAYLTSDGQIEPSPGPR